MNLQSDLIGQTVSVLETRGSRSNGFTQTGEHPGKIRALWLNEHGSLRFLVEEAGRLAVRWESELRTTGSGL